LDAGNPASKPEQLNVKDNVAVSDHMIALKNEEIEDAFFIPLFNPLINRVNMTATESTQRMNIALQNLVPAIGRLTHEYMTPMFIRIYNVLLRQGVYPEMPNVLKELGESSPVIGFNSKATMAIKQLEIAGIYQTLENVLFLSQADPSVLDNYDLDEVARITGEANSVPNTILRSKIKVTEKREADAEAQAIAQQQAQTAQMAEVYNKTSKAPEAGSGADLLMRQSL